MTEQKSLAECCSSLLFLDIFKTFRIAIQPARLITAFLALAIVFIAGWLMDFSKTVVVSGKITSNQLRSTALISAVDWPTELHCFVSDPQQMDNFKNRYKSRTEKQGVFKVWSNFCLARFNEAASSLVMLNFNTFIASVMGCVAACIWALKYHTIYSIIFLLIAMVMFSIAGGALCRGAALQFSKNEKPGITQCLRFAFRKFISLFFAPVAPIILIIFLGVLGILSFGLLTNIPWAGELILALFVMIVLLAGGLIALAIFGIGGGVNLMFGAIAYENSDAFDAVNRSWRYAYNRPWRLGFYTFLAAFYGSICYLFVNLFAFLTLAVSRAFLSVIIWTKGGKAELTNKLDVLWPKTEFFDLTGGSVEISKRLTESIAAVVINLEVLVIAGLVLAFVVSFYFTVSTIIYCLLRNKIDNVALDNVFMESEQMKQPAEVKDLQQPE
ncbi:MAG: hypothetical protein ABSE89_10375 [Sedimentisphaerales bacterium]